MKGDFVDRIQIIPDCFALQKRRDFISGPIRATVAREAKADWDKETQRFCDWLVGTDDCGRLK